MLAHLAYCLVVVVSDRGELTMLALPARVEVSCSDIRLDFVVAHRLLQINTGLDDGDHLSFSDETAISCCVHGGACVSAVKAARSIRSVLRLKVALVVSSMGVVGLDFALTEVSAQVLPDRVDGGAVSWRSILYSSISCVGGSLHANLAHHSHLISHVRVSLHSILADSLFVG